MSAPNSSEVTVVMRELKPVRVINATEFVHHDNGSLHLFKDGDLVAVFARDEWIYAFKGAEALVQVETP